MNLLGALYLISKSKLPLHGDFQSPAKGVFIVGCGRSGTTVLRRVLETHPKFSSGPETHIFTKINIWYERLSGKSIKTYDLEWISENCTRFNVIPGEITRIRAESSCLPEFAHRFFERFLLKDAATRWIEKTPGHVKQLDYISRYFPLAKFVHIVRDPRDVVCSLRTHPQWKIVHGELRPHTINRPVRECLERWMKDVSAGLQGRSICPDRYLETRYEDILQHPKEQLERLLSFLGEDWDERLLQFHQINVDNINVINNPRANQSLDTARIGRWKTELDASELSYIRNTCGDLAKKLGYVLPASDADST